MPNMFDGLKLVSDHHMADRKQVTFPRSKKRRIRKKWAKQAKHYKWIPWDTMYRMGNTIFLHPSKLAELKKTLSNSATID